MAPFLRNKAAQVVVAMVQVNSCADHGHDVVIPFVLDEEMVACFFATSTPTRPADTDSNCSLMCCKLRLCVRLSSEMLSCVALTSIALICIGCMLTNIDVCLFGDICHDEVEW